MALIPDNTSLDKIESMIKYVSKYAIASSLAGLKLNKITIQKASFWPELDTINHDSVIKSEGVIPKNAIKTIKKLSYRVGYPTYLTNACALSIALGIPCIDGFYNDFYCIEKIIVLIYRKRYVENSLINLQLTKDILKICFLNAIFNITVLFLITITIELNFQKQI